MDGTNGGRTQPDEPSAPLAARGPSRWELPPFAGPETRLRVRTQLRAVLRASDEGPGCIPAPTERSISLVCDRNNRVEKSRRSLVWR